MNKEKIMYYIFNALLFILILFNTYNYGKLTVYNDTLQEIQKHKIEVGDIE